MRITQATPRTAAPVQLTTPPEVYELGTYWRSRLRGVESEMMAPARKIAMYIVVCVNMKRIAGRLGLKEGTIPECPGEDMLGMGTMGG